MLAKIILLFLALLILTSGCLQPGSNQNPLANMFKFGPGGCMDEAGCRAYCETNLQECINWCNENEHALCGAIAGSYTGGDLGTPGSAGGQTGEPKALKEGGPVIGNAVFACENDNSVQTRGYVYLHGFGDHNPNAFDYQRDLIAEDPKTKDILDFDYDEKLSIVGISEDFVSQFDEFVSENDFEEIVIIGQSAGGTIAAYSAHKLNFTGTIELHTLASPLRGCDNKGFAEQFVPGEGFYREIGIGLGPFLTPANNVRVYHHKTVNDETLTQCDTPVLMQYNNIAGSQEFYYPELNHETIMPTVSKIIIDCHK
jgi:hypothetical protein